MNFMNLISNYYFDCFYDCFMLMIVLCYAKVKHLF